MQVWEELYMKSNKLKKFISVALCFTMCFTLIETIGRTNIVKADSNSQSIIPAVEAWPNIPSPFNIRDWAKTANDFYNLAFNTKAEGTDLPLIKTFNVDHPSSGGFTGETFSMPSYLSSSWGLGQYATQYSIQVSNDHINWTDAYSTINGKGGTENVSFKNKNSRYVRLNLKQGIGDKFEVAG